MIIKRSALALLQQKIQPNKVVLLYGPRRVGKTTLLQQFIQGLPSTMRAKFVNGESAIIQQELSLRSEASLRSFLGTDNLLIIDEAHHVPDIGSTLKFMVDTFPDLALVASGSASFALAQKVGEPLTGRKKTVHLYPIWTNELRATKEDWQIKDMAEELLLYGSYPEAILIAGKKGKEDYLRELTDSYLFRDILEIERVKSAKKLRDLLGLLAFQIGQEVSVSELANALDLHRETVTRYLDLLEKSFVVVNIRGFSRNLRKEITKTSRYYFYDVGVRNAIINNFNPLSLRNDTGQLWENYIVMERLKKQSYTELWSNNYFWRTYDQQEIDWVEEREGSLCGYEIKWQLPGVKPPKDWLTTYPTANYEIVHRENYLSFVA